MGIITGIISAVGSALGFLGNVGSAIGGVVGPILSDVESGVGDIAGAVSSALGSAVSSSVGAIGSAAGDVFGAIQTGFEDASSILSNILGTMQKYVDEVTNEVTKINDNFIKPVTDTVLVLDRTITSLITELHTDIHGGIQGILSIPDALANALTTVDAQLGRAMQELGLANKEMVTSTLLPGFDKIMGGPLSNIAAAAQAQAGQPVSLVDQIGQLHIASCLDTSSYMTKVNTSVAAIKEGTGLVGNIGKALLSIFWVLPYLGMSVKNDIECFGQMVNQQNPVKVLGPGEVVKAMYRGILSAQDAATEAAKEGLNGDRFQVMLENALWLPGPVEALQLFYRGMIDQTDLEAVLQKQALTPEDVQAVQGAFLEPVDPRLVMQQYAREQAAMANFLPASLGSVVPGSITALYPGKYRSPEQAKWDWLSHWKVPGLDWWFTAWARGLRTQTEFQLAAQAENVPFDLIPDLISIFQEPIPLWMIPDMLGSGVFTPEQALAYLKYLGIDDASANYISRYGLSKLKGAAASTATELAGLTVATAKTMYEDGIMDQATYIEILVGHGYGQEAAALMVELADLSQKTQASTAQVNSLVDDVAAGRVTTQDAVSQLYAAGYNTTQVDRAQAKMVRAIKAAQKLPSRPDLDDWRRDGIIGQAEWQSGYAQLGYSEANIARYETAWEAKHGSAN